MLSLRQTLGWLLISGLLSLPVGAVRAEDGLADSPIGRLAATLKPGDWAEIETVLPKGMTSLFDLFRVRIDDGRFMSIDGWTDSAHWDPRRRQTLFIGMRKYKRFIAYDSMNNAWQVLGWAGNAPPKFERVGHVYGRTALDWKRGHYYWLGPGKVLYRYLLDEARWESIDGVLMGGYVPIEMHEGMDALLAISRGGQLIGYRDGKSWEIGRVAVDGYHSVGRYNRARGDMLFAGGNASARKLVLVSKDGSTRSLRDAPFDIVIKNASLTYDPKGGNYLFMLRQERELHELDPDRDEWRLVRKWSESQWPFARNGFYTPVVIDELGVSFWQSETGNRVYRHASAFSSQ